MEESGKPFPGSQCHRCEYLRLVHNNRGSTFFICEYSRIDERFPKYPPQPVRNCPYFKVKTEE